MTEQKKAGSLRIVCTTFESGDVRYRTEALAKYRTWWGKKLRLMVSDIYYRRWYFRVFLRKSSMYNTGRGRIGM